MTQPKLRFKRDDGTEFPQLNKCCFMDLVDGKISNGLFTETSKIGSGVKLINVSNLYDEPYINYDKLDLLNVDVEILESNRVKPFDLLFTRSSVKAAGVAHCNIYTGNDYDVVFDGHIMKASIKTDSAIPMYVKYLMDSPLIRNRTLQKAKTGAFTTIGQEDLGSVILTITPSIEEQQKIADFLSTVDEVISRSEAEVQNLEQQKKAAMQKIFSQEVRFRQEDGTEFPEWEEKTIGELGIVITGNTPPTKDKDNYGGDFLWVTPTDISAFPIIYETERKLTEKGKTKARLLPKDTVLVTCIASIGKNCILSKEGSCNQQINAIIPFPFTNSYYLLNVINLKKHQLEMLGGNGGMKIVSKSLFERFVVPIPCFEEQQKIAGFLSTYDKAIACAKQELDKWKELKKGLLQQMFA